MTFNDASLPLTLGKTMIEVRSPFSGSLVGRAPETEVKDVSALIKSAKSGAKKAKALSRAQRAAILLGAAGIIEGKAEEFALIIAAEAGKTITQARKEVLRCVNTLTLSGEEAKRHVGEVLPFDSFEGSENRQGWFNKEPLGIITAITPFNDPLNLVAHKLGPAIASGNSVLLKPSELTPLSALALVDALKEAGLPEEIVSVAVGGADLGRAMVESRDVRMVSFTGGFATGEAIAASAGLKRLAMDLGGNAPVIVMDDCDLEKAVEACVSGAFWAAGQNCIGTQRILLHASIADEFRDRFVAQASLLKAGDPSQPETDVGPMITETAAERAVCLISEAVQAGASLLCGGTRNGSVVQPTVLEDVPVSCRAWSEEVFAPIVILDRFDDLDSAVASANSSAYSLHAGIFTQSLETALDLADRIEAAGVMINDSSDYRFDAMPFGGFKYGSLGREGVRFAIEEMSQSKTICINR